jgi:hypothetical protein
MRWLKLLLQPLVWLIAFVVFDVADRRHPPRASTTF